MAMQFKKNKKTRAPSKVDFLSPFYVFRAAKGGADQSIGAIKKAKNDITGITTELKEELVSKNRVQLHLDMKYVWIRTIGFFIIGVLGFLNILTGQIYTGFLMVVISAFVVYVNVTKYGLFESKNKDLVIKDK